MKILFISRRFPPSVGGMEQYAYKLSQALNQAGHEPTMITWGGSNKWLPIVLPSFFFQGVWQLLRHQDIAVIHVQDAIEAPIGWLLHKLFHKPYVLVVHGLDITYSKWGYQRLILPFVRRADAVLPNSQATAQQVLQRRVSQQLVTVVPLGVDGLTEAPKANKKALSNQLHQNIAERFLLLTTGRLVKRKGVAWFIRQVMPTLVKKYPQVLYLVAGGGLEAEAIRVAAQTAGLTQHVKLLGRVSDQLKASLYQSCDVFVMPNIVVAGDMEGFGIVVQEAAVARLPVVASKLEGIKDAIISGKNGLLVESGNPEAFIKAIEPFMANETYRLAFGKAARTYTLKEFSWTKTADRLVAVYQQVIK